MHRVFRFARLLFTLLCTLFVASGAVSAQVGVFSRDALIEYTPEWKGERFPDGRPKVPDSILERMKNVSITYTWSVLRGEGYEHQYEGDWKFVHEGQTLVGRAVTAMYMPRRPGVRKVMDEKGAKEGRIGDQISWPIDTLVKGDVYVADVYGLVENGPIIGDNLATAIYTRSGTAWCSTVPCAIWKGVRSCPVSPVSCEAGTRPFPRPISCSWG